MTNTQKRTISAAQLTADIRGGMRKDELMRKYGLSEKQLQTVLKKLRAKQSAKKSVGGSPPEHTTPATQVPRDPAPRMVWQCPACSCRQPQACEECPSCGIVVAKFTANQPNESSRSDATRFLAEAPAVSESSSWVAGWVSSVLVSVVALSILGYAIMKWLDYWDKTSGRTDPMESEYAVGVAEQPSRQSRGAGMNRPPRRIAAVEHSEDSGDDGGDSEDPESSEETEYSTGFVQEFTVANFQEAVMEASKSVPVLVEFYADT